MQTITLTDSKCYLKGQELKPGVHRAYAAVKPAAQANPLKGFKI